MQFEELDLEGNNSKHRTIEPVMSKKEGKARSSSDSEEQDAFDMKSHSINSRFKRKQSIYIPEKEQQPLNLLGQILQS